MELQRARSSHEVQQVVKLLDLMYEEAKEALVTTPPEGFSAGQAKAQQLGQLSALLSRPSFAETQAQYKTTTKE